MIFVFIASVFPKYFSVLATPFSCICPNRTCMILSFANYSSIFCTISIFQPKISITIKWSFSVFISFYLWCITLKIKEFFFIKTMTNFFRKNFRNTHDLCTFTIFTMFWSGYIIVINYTNTISWSIYWLPSKTFTFRLIFTTICTFFNIWNIIRTSV